MNRLIQFRAWNSKVKAMSNSFTLAQLAEADTAISKYETVMQFTGLTDKNGTEIYEGDIVVNDLENCVIRFDTLTASFNCYVNDLWHDGRDKWRYREGLNNYMKVEVIGNIYNNPDLLRGLYEQK